MHPALLPTLALEIVHERQARGERLARLLPHPLPAAGSALRRRLVRLAAAAARWLDEELPTAPPASRWA